MPNWCFSDYALVGSEEDVKKAHDSMSTLEETPRSCPEEPWSFLNNSNWLGFVVEDIIKKSYKEYSCRGTFNDLDFYKDGDDKWVLAFTTETAWGPCYDLIEALADLFNLRVNYTAEELGMCFFEKHDKDDIFPKNFYYSDETNVEYFDTLEQFIEEYGEFYGLTKDSTFEESQEAVNNTDNGMLFRYKCV